MSKRKLLCAPLWCSSLFSYLSGYMTVVAMSTDKGMIQEHKTCLAQGRCADVVSLL